MNLIQCRTADEAWREAARLICEEEHTISQSSRGGDTVEIPHACLVISQPWERWVLNRHPALNPSFALAEVIWILSGRDDAGFLNFWNPALPRFAGKGPLYYGSYGHRLRYRFGIDQIHYAYQTLAENPDSRQVVLQIWDASSDLPIHGGQPRNEDIPCNICSLLKVRRGKLEWTQVMRSNDLHLGWPHNVVQFTTLQEMMAGWLGLECGSYTHYSDSLHIYCEQRGSLNVDEVLDLEPNSDRWCLPYAETMEVVAEIGGIMDRVRENASDVKLIEELGSRRYSSQCASNTLCIILADAARRAGAAELAEVLIGQCTNPLLRQLSLRWSQRQAQSLSRG